MSAPGNLEGLPWPPGDSGQLHAAAHQAAGLADRLDGVGSKLAATQTGNWSGVARASFGASLVADEQAVGLGVGSFRSAAGTLKQLATVVQHAQETVRQEARKLHEARHEAAVARAKANQARAAANSAAAAAASNPLMSSTLGAMDPASQAAQRANGDAIAAEGAAAGAEQHAADVQRHAEAAAHHAVLDVQKADRETAGKLDGLAGQLGAPSPGSPGSASILPPGGLGALGQYLRADFANFWSGGDGNNFPYGSGAKGALFMLGVGKWSASAWSSAAENGASLFGRAFSAGDPLAVPTFNNGMLGKGAVNLLNRLPGGESAAGWLGDASKATPVFRGLGVAGGLVSTGMDGYQLVHQYGWNPIAGVQKGGADYVSQFGKTAFSASTTAFLVAPNPVTGGAVVVSGAVWLGAEAYKHREEIVHAAEWTGQQLAKPVVAAAHVQTDLTQGTTRVLGDVGQGLGDATTRSVHGAGQVATDLWNLNPGQAASDGFDTAKDVASTGAHTIINAGGDALDTLGNAAHDAAPWNW